MRFSSAMVGVVSMTLILVFGSAHGAEPNYEIAAISDLSRKAGVESLDQSVREMENLPENKKVRYKIVLPDTETSKAVKAVTKQIIARITSENPGYDEVILWLYSEGGLTNGPYDIGSVVWAPKGKLGNVTPAIARSDDRSSYATGFDLKDDLDSYLATKRGPEEARQGLTEKKRRAIYRAIARAEQKAAFIAEKRYPWRPIFKPGSATEYCVTPAEADGNYAKFTEYEEELTSRYTKDLREKYGISKATLGKVKDEGLSKKWPTPDAYGNVECSDLQ